MSKKNENKCDHNWKASHAGWKCSKCGNFRPYKSNKTSHKAVGYSN